MKTQNRTLINIYLAEQVRQSGTFPREEVSVLIDTIEKVYKEGGRIFTFGNGGGASIASHFATDLGIHPFVSENKKRVKAIPRLTVICLNESNSSLTCMANDIGFEWIFVEQLKSYFLNEKDLVIAFSTSGNSPNIVYALTCAEHLEATTALIGGRDGGKAKMFADICILISGHSEFPGQTGVNDNCFHIEDFQQSIAHMVTGILEERING